MNMTDKNIEEFSEEEKLRELKEEQEQYIQEQYNKDVFRDYKNNNNQLFNGNGKSNKKNNNRINNDYIDYGEELIEKYRMKVLENKMKDFVNGSSKAKKNDNNPSGLALTEKEIERNKILNEIQKLRQKNSSLTFYEWSTTLKKKHQILIDKITEHFPKIAFKILLELDFVLSLKTILNIGDITLPFMGIVFAAPSSMKTQIIELFEKWIYSYYTDKFTAKSFVSHSATVAKEKLKEVDLLPRIKNKILLTS
jgi:hypothetical protein